MAKLKYKPAEVSVSFHFMEREILEGTDTTKVPFTTDDIDKIYQGLKGNLALDFSNEVVADMVRQKSVVPIAKIEDLNERTICGQFKSSYWGHSYENVDVGDISAESINLRPFFFLIYLDESGRIHIAAQYLGYYGGYTGLKNTIRRFLDKSAEIKTHSFNIGNVDIKNAVPKELEISFLRKHAKHGGQPIIGQSGAIVFKKQGKGDTFPDQIKAKVLSRKSKKDVKSALASLLNANDMFEIDDEEIEDAKVIAIIDGKRKVIRLLDESNYATKFPLSVPLQADGHPQYEPMKVKVLEVLTSRILSLKK